jgi:hypothetical protein
MGAAGGSEECTNKPRKEPTAILKIAAIVVRNPIVTKGYHALAHHGFWKGERVTGHGAAEQNLSPQSGWFKAAADLNGHSKYIITVE